jgi:hypothetical protein
MNNSKLVDNKRRSHVEKVLHKMSKKASQPKSSNSETEESIEGEVVDTSTLREQYEIIRTDILKLREDLSKGYDIARSMLEKKGFITQLLRAAR